jgi:putative ABC transport system permease protein
MTQLLRDLRFGFRVLAKTPGHTLAAVLALALGIGLSTAMFSIVYGAVLRGLPFERSDRLMHIENDNPSKDQRSIEVSLPDFLAYRERQRSFEGIAAFNDGTVNLSGDERPERYDGAFISANFLDLLRVRPLLGRGFRPEEAAPGAAPVVLLGWGVWQTRYDGDPKVIGRPVRVNGEAGTIVGVMPQGFAFPLTQEVWVPLREDTQKMQRGKGETLEVFGRLRGGVSLEQARSEMQTITKALAAEFPETNEGRGAVVKPYTEEFIGKNAARLLYIMLGACLFVLLLACTNVASLMMARASKRTREIAIRSALGARRRRLIGQLLTESLLLSFLGAALGVLLASVGVRIFNAAIVDKNPPFWVHIAVDPTALLFTLGAAVLAAAVSGLLPAFQASRTDVNEVLKDEGRGSSSLRVGAFTRGVVIFEIAISCVLLVGAGLMIQNVIKMAGRIEVDTASLFTARVALFDSMFPEKDDRVRFFDGLLERLRDDPAVRAAAVSTYLPGTGAFTTRFAIEGAVYPKPEDHPSAHIGWVSSGFFETLGVGVDQGRDFNLQDRKDSLPVAIVNRSFARKHWPGQDPLGRRIRQVTGAPASAEAEPEPWRTVIGVVPDLGMAGLEDDEPESQGFYIPVRQDVPSFASLVVRTRDRNPMTVTDRVRGHVTALNRDLPIYWVLSLERVVAGAAFFSRLFATLFSIFGVAALVLASVGIYGVIAFSVQQRTQEIGIRMALGAQQGNVLGMIVRQGLAQLAFGLGLGVLGAWPAAKLLGNFLVGVQPHDPPTFLGVCLVLAAVALFACWVPAQRASRTDPLVAIRYD